MKKILLSLGLCIGLCAGVYAKDNTLDQLNQQFVEMLDQFQDKTTEARLKFDAVETDADRALKVGLNAFYRKSGSQNTFELKVDNLSYDYGDGKSPTTILKSSFGLDFTKILSKEEVNLIIPNAIEFFQDYVRKYTEEYGDAASIRGVVTSTSRDEEGNYTGLSALISTKIDLGKLPEELTSEDVPMTDMVLSITLNVKKGVTLEGFGVSNPEYRGFKQDEMGLKELLDMLLLRDDKGMEWIMQIAFMLDEMASEVVEMEPKFIKDVKSYLHKIPSLSTLK